MAKRSKRCDGLSRRIRGFLLQNFAPMWGLFGRIPFLAKRINGFIINTACNAAPFRPHAMSTVHDYTSWTALTDKKWLGRALPPTGKQPDLPPVAEVASLFVPDPGGQRECPKSTVLFPVFAQYLTDGFLRTDMKDRRRTTSNHDIDLSPLYGRTPAQTAALRLKSGEAGEKGRLKSQIIDGEEFPPDLFKPGTTEIADDFMDGCTPILDPPLGFDVKWGPDNVVPRRLFAVGGDRANATALISAMNTLWLREHNRLAGELEKRHPGWDDDRLFETARNIVIVMFIKLVVEEYINHISSAAFRLRADPRVAWPAAWNKPNWMTVEFSLLYRWHSLIPEKMKWGEDGGEVPSGSLGLNNSALIEAGLANAFRWASETHAAKLDLHNTPIFLEQQLTVESRAIQQGRDQRLQGYNAYRQLMGLPRVDGFDCITADEARREELRALYGHPDKVEFYVGLFAEDNGPNTPMPPLLGGMVALDAFSQALNNPLLSEQVYNTRTFTPFGMAEIEATTSLADILARNLGAKRGGDISTDTVRMTRRDWHRSFVGI